MKCHWSCSSPSIFLLVIFLIFLYPRLHSYLFPSTATATKRDKWATLPLCLLSSEGNHHHKKSGTGLSFGLLLWWWLTPLRLREFRWSTSFGIGFKADSLPVLFKLIFHLQPSTISFKRFHIWVHTICYFFFNMFVVDYDMKLLMIRWLITF